MRKIVSILRLFFGRTGFFLLFILNFLYIFISLGLFSFGLIVFPASILGILGVLVIVTDIGLPVLMTGGLGILLLGGGMCGMIPFLCRACVNRLHYFRVGTEWRKKAEEDEET